MHAARIKKLLTEVGSLKPQTVGEPGLVPPMTLFSSFAPPSPWEQRGIEETLGLTLPAELVSLWNSASSLRLFEDRHYGQWGLITWPPGEALRQNPGERYDYRRQEFRPGDLLVGEFLGDLERVLIRCERGQDDFGSVMIVAELDHREDWFKPSRTILDFLEQFVAAEGEKFWEPKTKECRKCRRGMSLAATTCPHCGEAQDLIPG